LNFVGNGVFSPINGKQAVRMKAQLYPIECRKYSLPIASTIPLRV